MSSQQWKNEKAVRYNLLIKKESDVYQAIQKACKIANIKPTSYVQTALREKLTRDGFLPANSESVITEAVEE